MSRAKQIVESSLILGIQFDEVQHRAFLSEYVNRVAPNTTVPEEIDDVLTGLIPQVEPDYRPGVAGSVLSALRRFTASRYELDLRITGRDYGPVDPRLSPYRVERTSYHIGTVLLDTRVEMEFPGYAPYATSRKWDIPAMREHFDRVIDFLPDYLWWALQDRRGSIQEQLELKNLAATRRAIAKCGFPVTEFGLYLTSFQKLLVNEGT